MNNFGKISVFLLRISMGWMFLYSGITKIMNPGWSAAGYIGSAKTFAPFYEALLNPSVLPAINFLNSWGQALIGIALLLGLGTRIASFAGALMMLLYYLPILDFPYPNPNSFIVDQHIIYIFAFFALAALKAGRIIGLDGKLKRFPKLADFIG